MQYPPQISQKHETNNQNNGLIHTNFLNISDIILYKEYSNNKNIQDFASNFLEDLFTNTSIKYMIIMILLTLQATTAFTTIYTNT